MRRVIKTLIVLTLFALAAVAVSTGGARGRRSSARLPQLPTRTGRR